MFRVQSVITESVNSFHIQHFLKVCIVPSFDLLDLVRCSETVKEMNERNSSLDSGKVSNSTQIHDFLRV